MARTGTRQLEVALASASGHFDEAQVIAAEGMHAAGHDHAFEQLLYSAHILAMRVEQGQLTDVIGQLRALNDGGHGFPAWTAMLASALAHADRVDEAAELFGPLIDHEPSGFATDFASALSIRYLSETCRQFGDANRAAKLLPHLEPWAGQLLVVVYVSTVEAASDRCIGHLLATLGRYDEADAAYARAAAVERSAGFLPLLARTEYWHARALYERGAPGDGQRARALLDEVVEISDRIGMRLLAKQARTWRESSPSEGGRLVR
jgi:tetratricopeptide (TPR) repeat protein